MTNAGVGGDDVCWVVSVRFAVTAVQGLGARQGRGRSRVLEGRHTDVNLSSGHCTGWGDRGMDGMDAMDAMRSRARPSEE